MVYCPICRKDWKNERCAIRCCILPDLVSIAENTEYGHMKQALDDFISELMEKLS